jgi:hypothetical protein
MTTVHNMLLMVCEISILVLLSCETKDRLQGERIVYPEPRPDSGSMIFLPGVVSSDSIDFGSAFSPDGRSFYFARTIDKRSGLYVSKHNGTVWTAPVRVPFANINYAEADPAFSPDGKLFFISTRPKNESDTLTDYDIWFATLQNDGSWSHPENAIEINSDSAEYYISFSDNGNVYFASSRAGGFGQEDLYMSKRVNGNYSAPENLGASLNTKFSEYDPFVSRKESFIIFTSSGRQDGFGKGDLYLSSIGDSAGWSDAYNLGGEVNTRAREYCPYITPDEKYFFFTSDGDIKWMALQSLKEN